MVEVVNFQEELEFGNWGEETMRNWIERSGVIGKPLDVRFDRYNKASYYEHYSVDKLKEYDLSYIKWTDNTFDKITFEVKTDKHPVDTGNIIFEKKCVEQTKSTYWIHFMPLVPENNLYFIETNKLKTLLEMFKTHLVYGGYKNLSLMYRIHHSELDEVFIKAGGSIFTWNKFTIPTKYNLTQFSK